MPVAVAKLEVVASVIMVISGRFLIKIKYFRREISERR